jgi:hypothetical protein
MTEVLKSCVKFLSEWAHYQYMKQYTVSYTVCISSLWAAYTTINVCVILLNDGIVLCDSVDPPVMTR